MRTGTALASGLFLKGNGDSMIQIILIVVAAWILAGAIMDTFYKR